jgi:hypothetical protein
MEDIADIIYTGRVEATHEFMAEHKFVQVKSDTDILIPQINFFTNDSGSVINAYTSASMTSGTPILLQTKYSKGLLYVLTIPEAQGDLYSYPQPVLNLIREVVAKDMYVRLDAPSQVSLFVYDNHKFIVESFRDRPVPTHVVTDKRITKLRDMLTGQELTGIAHGSTTVFDMSLAANTYRVFSAE